MTKMIKNIEMSIKQCRRTYKENKIKMIKLKKYKNEKDTKKMKY